MRRAEFRFFGSMSAVVVLAGLAACRAEIGDDPSGGEGDGVYGTGGSSVVSMPPKTNEKLDVGTVPIHRLSNAEYNNTVRDLLGSSLRPADQFLSEEALGFDNIAEALGMNPRQVAGYYDAASKLAAEALANMTARSRIVTCEGPKGDATCARNIVTTFGRRAFRRPLEDWEANDLVTRYQEAVTQGLDHNGAVQHVVRIMLTSPQFLYRMEFDKAPESAEMHPLNAYEVASRLSYSIWSSTPDDQLLDLAGSGALLKPETLQAQVDRMLSDPRSSALVDNFAGQWLGSRYLGEHVVDPVLFPAWDEGVRTAMQGELGMFFDEFLHHDAPFDQFLAADVNFVDAKLAGVYGFAAPGGQGLVKVQNTTDHRRGFLGLAGFLTHTSRNTRTAPSIRAKWVVNGLLCMTLEVPANLMINPLPEPTGMQTVRQQLETHRAKPECAPCHNILDPVGLGLEHFDAIGRYRETYDGGVKIDTAGKMPDGTPFDGLDAMTDILGKDPQMVPCAAEKLFTYGLGRGVDPSRPYVDQIVEKWRTGDLGLRNLIKQFVINDTFRFRRGSPPK